LKKQQTSQNQALISEEIYTSTHFKHYNAGKYVLKINDYFDTAVRKTA